MASNWCVRTWRSSLKVLTTSALEDLNTVTDLIGCSEAWMVVVEVIAGVDTSYLGKNLVDVRNRTDSPSGNSAIRTTPVSKDLQRFIYFNTNDRSFANDVGVLMKATTYRLEVCSVWSKFRVSYCPFIQHSTTRKHRSRLLPAVWVS